MPFRPQGQTIDPLLWERFFSGPGPELPSRTRRHNKQPLCRVPLDVWGSKQTWFFFIHIHEELNITAPIPF